MIIIDELHGLDESHCANDTDRNWGNTMLFVQNDDFTTKWTGLTSKDISWRMCSRYWWKYKDTGLTVKHDEYWICYNFIDLSRLLAW